MSIPNVAVRYILDKPAVAGVIVGSRLGVSEHLEDNAKVFYFNLDGSDYEQINAVVGNSRDFYYVSGDNFPYSFAKTTHTLRADTRGKTGSKATLLASLVTTA